MAKKHRKPLTKRRIRAVFERDGHKCVYCNRTPPDIILSIDHFKPISQGGSNKMENLTTTCIECNRDRIKPPINDDFHMCLSVISWNQIREQQ
jgi:5-methylcytosine-specific restriction endonuclease McrA